MVGGGSREQIWASKLFASIPAYRGGGVSEFWTMSNICSFFLASLTQLSGFMTTTNENKPSFCSASINVTTDLELGGWRWILYGLFNKLNLKGGPICPPPLLYGYRRIFLTFFSNKSLVLNVKGQNPNIQYSRKIQTQSGLIQAWVRLGSTLVMLKLVSV